MRIGFIIILFVVLSNEVKSQKATNHLYNKSDFENLSGLPLTNKYGQTTAIKLVYDLKFKKLYFINSKYYTYCNTPQKIDHLLS